MSYQVRYTEGAKNDLVQLYKFLLDNDIEAARRALAAIRKSVELLENFPFSCRKSSEDNPFLREMVVPFGGNGYVTLFEIEPDNIVTTVAVRHQREDDFF